MRGPGAQYPVAWLEGMFVRPQHLQQHELQTDTRLRHQLRSLDPFHWGVRTLVVNEEALCDHRVEIMELDVILPSGAVLRYPSGCTLDARTFEPPDDFLDVWVGLRRPAPNEPSAVRPAADAPPARYRLQAMQVSDVQRGVGEASIEFLVPQARVFLIGTDTPREALELEQHDAVRVARIAPTGELKVPFALARDAAPPLLAVQAFPPLEKEIREIVEQLAARVRVVAGRTTTLAIADLPRMWMRYTLARMTPVLRQLLRTGATRPFDLYMALVETAAALGAFALQEPADFPPYDHAEPYPCFHAVLDFIDQHLEEAVPDRFTELEMRYDGRAYTTKELTLELADPRNHFFIGIRADLDAEELASLVKEFAKCAEREELNAILMMNLGGLRLDPLPGAPTEIAARVGFHYWRLETQAKFWQRVRSDGSLALSLKNLERADVRLYVVSREE